MFAKILFLYSAIKTGEVASAEAVYTSLSREVVPLTRYDIDVNCNAETLVSRFKEVSKKIGAERYVIFATGAIGGKALLKVRSQDNYPFHHLLPNLIN